MVKRNHLDFLCTVGELGAVLADSSDVPHVLHRLVEMVAKHMQADVCSVYLYDTATRTLVLRATTGLRREMEGVVRLDESEGLVGLALRELRPILENHASTNPNYRFFKALGEDAFESFLAVPIQRGVERIGVITAQREERNHFHADDVTTLRAVASQLAGIIETARLLMSVSQQKLEGPPEAQHGRIIHGTVAAPGYAFGNAVIHSDMRDTLDHGLHLPPAGLDEFRSAVERTEQQVTALQVALGEFLPEAATLIFEAQLLMLKDDGFVGEMETRIRNGESSGVAIAEVAGAFVSLFRDSAHAYMREKEKDILDVSRRMLDNLADAEGPTVGSLHRPWIMVARELYPSDIVMSTIEGVTGIVLVGGGLTTHVSILARSLELPLIITEDHAVLGLGTGSQLLLDGATGNVYVNPSEDIQARFKAVSQQLTVLRRDEVKMREVTETEDGIPIHLLANINLLSELLMARELKAEGVGLYRTEFPFMIRSAFPSEEEQYRIYRRLAQAFPDKPVTFRTLDIGGDKMLAYFDHGAPDNPALGLRSIRFCLRHREIFVQQIRAILRAGEEVPNIRIMFPMISSLDEFREARQIVDECVRSLRDEAVPHCARPMVGMMVELPAVLGTIDAFAREADFFSVGTNDFVQYMLAVDRGDSAVSRYYCAHHPSVLRGLGRIAEAANRHGTEVTICGEMAHQRRYLSFLLGIGFDRFSVDPHYLPHMQQGIGSVRLTEATEYARKLLQAETIEDAAACLGA